VRVNAHVCLCISTKFGMHVWHLRPPKPYIIQFHVVSSSMEDIPACEVGGRVA
jgi:hypothetical protein